MNTLTKIVLPLAVAAGLGAGGYLYYTQVYAPTQAVEEEAPLQTAAVQQGDILVTAQGTGTLVPAAELDLGFRTSGVMVELNVSVGDTVEKGRMLARLDDTAAQMQLAQAELNLQQAEENLASLTSPAALAAAELDVVTKQDTLDDAVAYLNSIQSPDIAAYQSAYDTALANLKLAQNAETLTDLGQLTSAVANAQTAIETTADILATVQNELAKCNCDPETFTVRIDRRAYTLQQALDNYNGAVNSLTIAQINLEAAQVENQQAIDAAQETAEDAYQAMQFANYGPTTKAVSLAQAQVNVAQADLDAAKALLAELNGESLPEGAIPTLSDARRQVEEAKIAVQDAKLALDNTVLTAPFSGTITAVNAAVGESVGSSAVLTLADLVQPMIQFYIDETDLGYVDVDYPVSIVFDAAPDVTFTGQVVRVDPALVTIENSSVVQAWARLNTDSNDAVRLVVGMNASVEITAGEAQNVMIVPVEALRELGPDSYAVFVVESDGQLKLTPVTVGLKDFTNAEIKSGLQPGEVVSTGIVETGS